MDEHLKEQLIFGSKILFIFILGLAIINGAKQQAVDASVNAVMDKLQLGGDFIASGFSGASWTCNKYLPELWNCSGSTMTPHAMAEVNAQCSTLVKAQNYTCFEYVLVKKATAEQIAAANPELMKKSPETHPDTGEI